MQTWSNDVLIDMNGVQISSSVLEDRLHFTNSLQVDQIDFRETHSWN